MNKLVLGAVVGLLAFGLSSAQAQYLPPPTTPFVRQPLFPYTGGPGGLAPYGYGPLTGYPFGGGLMPYGTSAYNVVPYAAGPFGTVPGVLGAGGLPPVTTTGLTDPTVTGHPTRFFNYSRYFFNQRGAVSVPLPGTQPVLGANPTVANPLIGTAPLRGRAKTGTGK
jgi:hypothetical protein